MKSLNVFLTRISLAIASLCVSSLGAQAATIQVAASSNYFGGWSMAKFVTPVPTAVAGVPINATVDGIPFTINTVGSAPAKWSTWGSGQSTSLMSSTDLPTGIGIPTAPGNVWELAAGTISIKFQAPMIPGTTFFSHDFDAVDAVEYRFYRCDGSQIDATSVDFLRIATANNPTQTPPVGGATDSFWKLASVANVGLSGTTSGLIVNAADVCEIRVKELGLPGHSSIDMMLGLPPANPLPTDDTAATNNAVPVTIELRANDSTSQPGHVNLAPPTITTQPAHGSVTIDGSGNAVYTPDANFTGTDTFKYQVCTQATPPRCAEAMATITVTAIPPTPPVINDASYTTPLNTPINGNAGTGGQIPPGSAFQTVTPPAHGQLTIDPTTGAFTYTPNTGYTGPDTAIVRVCLAAPNSALCDDATLTFDVKSSGGINGSSATPVPTLSEWTLMRLASLVAMIGVFHLRRRQS